MADANLIADNSMNESGNDFGDEADDGLSMVSTGFYPTQEETLTPLGRLQKYWDSDNVFNRQMVARNLLDTLRAIFTNNEDLEEGLKVLVCLSEDIEPMVRSELMEQIPHLAMFCSENRNYFPNTIHDTILPTVVRYLTDSNNQVRKTSQAALLVLLEQELIDRSDMVEQVCPVIIQLSSPDSSDDYRTEAVALMSKVAPLTGCDITERFFLPHFTVLCKDSHFHLRKNHNRVILSLSKYSELWFSNAKPYASISAAQQVCAANIGDICNVVGQESTEAELLPRFEALCQDGVWGVRKACAECFMTVSCAVSSDVRKERLSPLFVQLLCDQSRWVRMAAFQNLGPFISTFADPSISGVQLVYNQDGTVHIRMVDPELGMNGSNNFSEIEIGNEKGDAPQLPDESPRLSKTDKFEIQRETPNPSPPSNIQPGSTSQEAASSNQKQDQTKPVQVYSGVNEVNFTPIVSQPPTASDGPVGPSPGGDSPKPPQSEEGSSRSTPEGSEEEAEYNSFLYWRNPIAVVIQEDVVEDTPAKTNSSSNQTDDKETPPSEHSASSESNSENELHFGSSQDISVGGGASLEETVQSVPEGQVVSSATFNLLRHTSENETGDQKEIPLSSENNSQPIDGEETGGSSPVQEERPPESIGTISADISQIKLEDPSSSLSEAVGGGEEKSPTVGETINSHTQLQSAGVNVHRAEVNEAVYESETVTNIGTNHIIGASLEDKEVGFVNGVMEEQLPFWSQTEGETSKSQTSTLTRFQNVIPEQLLEQYLSMTDPTRAQTVDTEIAKHCAYSLPGVALTLGRRNWPCLKGVYDTLASDMQWKVRRTLAFSIHEMALILGDEITSLDLVPIFNGFLKDLDEVRIGVLKHFADFVKLLRPQLRQQYLNRMNDFLTTDNQRNWRFRLELAEQLIDMCEFYSPREVYDNILHIAIELACDRVADVRFMAYKLISRVSRIVAASGNQELMNGIIQQMKNKFAQSDKWFERQAYVHICQKFIEEEALDVEQFATDFLPSLLDLSADPIPNVRITLARTLAQSVMPLVYFTTINPLRERLLEVLSKLAEDEDADVGYYSRLAPIGETTIPDDEPPV